MTSTPASRSAATRSVVSGVGADGGADAQASALILAGAREFGGLLEVLDRDHAVQFMIAADHQHLLDAVLVQQRCTSSLGAPSRTVTSRSLGVITVETGASSLRSKRRSRCVTMPTTLAPLDHRHAGDAARRVVSSMTWRIVASGDGDRVRDHAALEFLDARDFARLRRRSACSCG